MKKKINDNLGITIEDIDLSDGLRRADFNEIEYFVF